MTDLLTQIGVGGLVAVMVLREFRAYAREQKDKKSNGNGNGRAGERTVEEWEGRMARIGAEANKPVIGILEKQTELLTQQKDLLQEMVFHQRSDPRSRAYRAGAD